MAIPMQRAELTKLITERIAVSRQDVTIAKSFILRHFQSDSSELLTNFLRHVEVPIRREMVVSYAADLEAQVNQVSDAVKWRLAFYEAVWQLVGTATLIGESEGRFEVRPGIDYDTGREKGGLKLFEDRCRLLVPAMLVLAPSVANEGP